MDNMAKEGKKVKELNRVMEDTHRVSLKAKVFQDKQE
jgi:hypothetical protein